MRLDLSRMENVTLEVVEAILHPVATHGYKRSWETNGGPEGLELDAAPEPAREHATACPSPNPARS